MMPIVEWDKKQIKYIFWGLVFFHFHVTINQIDLLPDFVGFILFYLALDGLAMDSGRYGGMKVMAILLAVVEAVLLVMTLGGRTVAMSAPAVLAMVAVGLLYAWFDWLLFTVLMEVAEGYGCDVRKAALTKQRSIRLGFNLFAAVAGLIAVKLPVFTAVATILGVVMMAWSCVEVRRLWKEMQQLSDDEVEYEEGSEVCTVVPEENAWLPPVEADEPVKMDIPEL